MYSDADLDDAVASGALSAEAADALRAHVAQRRASPAADEEHFRLITGFNDIFVVIAGGLLLLAIAWLVGSVSEWLGAAALAGASWVLAEFFTRRRRMALPSIALLLAFVVGSAFTVLLALEALLSAQPDDTLLAASGAAGAIAAWLHWRRFQVPITVAAGCAALAGTLLALLFSLIPALKDWLNPLLFACGAAVFALALYWDGRDPERRTRRSDVAFWLHLLASPLMVHPAFSAFGMLDGQAGVPQAIAVVVLYLLIATASIAIDRRALMVSALGYVLYAFTTLLKHSGVVSLDFALTALLLGGALLLLSAFWQPCRRRVLDPLPESLRRYLAPLR